MKANFWIMLSLTVLLVAATVWFYGGRDIIINEAVKKPVLLTINRTEDVKGLGYSGQRKIAVDSKGNYFVAYRKKYQGKYEVFVAKIVSQKGSWEVRGTDKPATVVGSDADQRVPSISIDTDDNIYLVWYGSDARSETQLNNRQIKFTRSVDGGETWSGGKNIVYVDGYMPKDDFWQEHPHILAGADKELYLVWEGKNNANSNQQIKFSRSSDGGTTWSAWKNVRATPNKTQSRPTLVLGGNGRLQLFMSSAFGNAGNLPQIQYAWSDDKGETWSQWETISDPNFDSRHESAVVDSAGVTHVVWRQWDAKGYSQIAHRSLQANRWSTPIILSTLRKYGFFPDIAADNEGGVTVSWMAASDASGLPNEDPTDGKVYAAVLVGGSLLSPVEISSGLYPHLPQAYDSASPTPLVYETASSEPGVYDIMFKW